MLLKITKGKHKNEILKKVNVLERIQIHSHNEAFVPFRTRLHNRRLVFVARTSDSQCIFRASPDQ